MKLSFLKIKLLWRKLLSVMIIFCLTTLISSCSFNNAPQNQSRLIQAILSDPKTFNAVLSQESPNIFGLTYEGLVIENPLTGKIEPALAQSWTISEDKLSIIFTLKKDLKWSDGEPLTVDDVVFSYNQLYLNEEIPSNARDSLRVGQSKALPIVEKVNNLQVKFTIPEPFAPFLESTGLSILPQHILAEKVTTKGKDGKPIFLSFWGVDTPPDQLIVNGAYKLKSYATSQRLIFTKNPYYWQKDENNNQLPYIEEVVWEIVESTDTSIVQFRSGNLDSIAVSPEYFSLLKKEENRGNFTIHNGGAAYGTTFMSFNLNQGSRNGKPLIDPIKSKWFNNVNFRKAIAYSINRERMINNIYRGLGEAQNSPISVQSPFYDATIKGYNYDPELAKKILLQEEFKYDENGRLLDNENNEVRFTLLTNAGNRIRESLGSQIKQDLSQIGITVDFSPIAFSVLVDKLTNSLDWEAHIIGFGAGNEPNGNSNLWFPDGNLHLFNQKPQPGRPPIQGRIIADWEAKIGNLYIEGARELNFEKRKKIYDETQQLAQEYLPLIYLVNPYSLAAVRNRIEGVEYSALGGAFWNLEKLKIKQN
ncbi:MAG: ABC transporter substrate-binding protein [Cyanobacteria bacterium]|nr:ABC transporter substrate-binding protein [Cyanobacteria bacterium CG_2015-16_32_12]NCO79545.1 ABC transporter substrate-binding protein [Cyanobacteria bacterium CG_2015-22_32_23]NCQ03614.1 ABC transporter substrate-binding protein [Cyanobacteria bacterium CG_2015-09_32_10]NCQ43017.1 ABC transporter substrate-binding protein [Cyanobacteria bacterium CG_2015-04_32_10]NCS86081.1 ABC transporter substrate-binding protein [Cyanobacteria bacterium CG_2015-02_32_10]